MIRLLGTRILISQIRYFLAYFSSFGLRNLQLLVTQIQNIYFSFLSIVGGTHLTLTNPYNCLLNVQFFFLHDSWLLLLVTRIRVSQMHFFVIIFDFEWHASESHKYKKYLHDSVAGDTPFNLTNADFFFVMIFDCWLEL